MEYNKNLYYSFSLSSYRMCKVEAKDVWKLSEEFIISLQTSKYVRQRVLFYFVLTYCSTDMSILWKITNDLSKYCLKISRLWQKIGVEKIPLFFFCYRWQVEIFAHLHSQYTNYWIDIIIFSYASRNSCLFKNVECGKKTKF